MRNYSNIEKYPLLRKTYIGYGKGVWRIVRYGRQWLATNHTTPGQRIVADTLGEISQQLKETANGAHSI